MRNRSCIYLVPFLALIFLFTCVDHAYAVAGLRVKCNVEGAELFLNGKSMGYGPGTFTPETGRYKLELRKDLADKSYYYYKTDITLKDGDVQTVDAQLEMFYADGRRADIDMEFVYVQGGEYEMGCGRWAGDCEGDEKGKDGGSHKVKVNDFYLGKYEVTVGQWRKFAEDAGYRTDAEKEGKGYVLNSAGDGAELRNGASWKNPGFPQNDRHPVVLISWNDADVFVKWLSGKTGKVYRLPTEAEWEYAARSGGKEYRYSWGNGSPSDNIAGEEVKRQFPKRPWPIWEGYDDGCIYTAEVGNFKPNEIGLHDMGGNVWEWCSDCYADDYYKNSPYDNPQGPGLRSGSPRVVRGGGWLHAPCSVRAANRDFNSPSSRRHVVGFRLAKTH